MHFKFIKHNKEIFLIKYEMQNNFFYIVNNNSCCYSILLGYSFVLGERIILMVVLAQEIVIRESLKKNNILRYKNKGHFLWRIIVSVNRDDHDHLTFAQKVG